MVHCTLSWTFRPSLRMQQFELPPFEQPRDHILWSLRRWL